MGCSSCAKAAASRVGNAPTNPIIIGTPSEGDQTVRVRVIDGGAMGTQDGAVKYVAGDGIDDFLGEGSIAAMSGSARGSGIRNGRPWYQVGRIGYMQIGPAQVRSEQTGEQIVELTVGG